MQKTHTYSVTVDVVDNGQFDPVILRDAIIGGIQQQMNEGNLTTYEDDSTEIIGFAVKRFPMDATRIDKMKSFVRMQIELWDAIRALEKEVGNDLEGLQDAIEFLASSVDNVEEIKLSSLEEVLVQYGIAEVDASKMDALQ